MEMKLIRGSITILSSSDKISIVNRFFVENVYFSYQKSYESQVSIIMRHDWILKGKKGINDWNDVDRCYDALQFC